MAELVLVCAIARNGVIGGGNQLLWRLPSDLKRFRMLTWGKPLIMGRKTFASIGRALPGRETIVLTRDQGFCVPGVHVAHDLASALQLGQSRAAAMGADEIILAGGAELYAALLDKVVRMHLTEVDMTPQGDAFFPAIDPAKWQETARHSPTPDPRDAATYHYVDYKRRD